MATETQEKSLAKVGQTGMERVLQAFKIEDLEPKTIKDYLCPEATEQELIMFIYTCRQLNLNPFLKQIYLVKYKDRPAQMVVSFKEFLKRAHGYPNYRGFTCDVVMKGTEIDSAECTIYFTDGRVPFVWRSYFKENAKRKIDGGLMATWASQPTYQIGKCAIKQAHELCFPQLYSDIADLEIAGDNEIPKLQEPDKPTSVNGMKVDSEFYGPSATAKLENTELPLTGKNGKDKED